MIDFDDTIRETIADPTPKNSKDRRPPFKPEEVKLIPGIKEKIKEWMDKGWFVVGVSNQSGIEKGIVTKEKVEETALETFRQLGYRFPFYYAPHKRKGNLLHLRKPNIGMAELVYDKFGPPDLENSFMVGDYITDKQFADNLGIKYVDVSDFIKKNDKIIFWEEREITKDQRKKKHGHKGKMIWMTGLSGSGKSTIAKRVEKELFFTDYHIINLDGDNIRHGLCSDLGFSIEDRGENIRRIGEVGKLLVDYGLIVVCSFISPIKKQREFVRGLFARDDFIEVYIKCNIEECEKRDPKGLYRKYYEGDIKEMTGMDSPYEEPENPELTIETNKYDLETCVNRLISRI